MSDPAGFVAEATEAIGPSPVLSIMRVYGGGRVYIPKRAALDDDDPLVRLLGRPLAERLSDRLGGEKHDVPTAATIETAERNSEILRRFRAGYSSRQIAQHFGVSRRTVWRAIQGVPYDTPDKG